MSHVLLMLCEHVQDKDLYMSHNMKSYIWKHFFFSPYESPYPQECILACIGDHDSHGTPMSYAKSTSSPGMTLCKTWTSSHGCVGSSYCQYNHISFTPIPNPPFFFYFWLEWKFLVDIDLWLCSGQAIQWFGLTLAFMNFLKCYQSISHSGPVYEPAMYRLMKGDMWSLQSIPEGNFNSTSF